MTTTKRSEFKNKIKKKKKKKQISKKEVEVWTKCAATRVRNDDKK